MKKILVLLMSLILAIGSCMTFIACGDNGTEEGVLTIRYFKGGYGDEWLKDSLKNFMAKEYGIDPSEVQEDVHYKLIADANVTNDQGNYLKNASQAPDILITQGGYEQYIQDGYIEPLDSVYETEVERIDGTKIKIKDFMLPNAYKAVTRQVRYNSGDAHSWVMPWAATSFSLAYNEDLLLSTTHTSDIEVTGVAKGEKWNKAPETVQELLAYFADLNTSKPTTTIDGVTVDVVPFGWCYDVSAWLGFIVSTWWAQIQGTTTSNFAGEGSFYDFFNFNSLDQLDQTGIQEAIDVFRSLIIDKSANGGKGGYINSDTLNNLTGLSMNYYNYQAAKGMYAVWVAGDFFENESIKTLSDAEKPNFETKFMFVPKVTDSSAKLTYIRTDEAFYIPSKATNKDMAKRFLAFMCNESEMLNYTQKCGGLRPFQYNPLELAPDFEWTSFQESFFNIYNNADERIMEYPANVSEVKDISPVYLYNRQYIHFYMQDGFASIFKDANKVTPASEMMASVKEATKTTFNNWRAKYPDYFRSVAQ